MKKNIMHGFYILFFVMALILPNHNIEASSNIILQDNFESYDLNSFPSSGGWSIRYNGAGNQYQYITDIYSNSGSKSFRLHGVRGWATRILNLLNFTPNIVTFETSFYSESVTNQGSFGLHNPDQDTWGADLIGCNFYYEKFRCAGHEFFDYVPQQWYSVVVSLNIIDKKISVWVNGKNYLDKENLNTDFPRFQYTHFQLTANNDGNNIVYYDDVKVYSGAPTTLLVTATAGQNGTVTPASRSVSSGETATFTVTPNQGYTHGPIGGTCPQGAFDGNEYVTGVITEDCSVSFSFNTVGGSTAVRTITGTGVGIRVTPASTISAWGVEETLPAGLTPGSITGSNGTWNATTRKITWYGTGSTAVTLGYAVSGDQGEYMVSGMASFDGVDTPVTGPSVITIGGTHPADTNRDWRISMSEAIAYLAGWQRGQNPMNFAIRAAYIWQNGEEYRRQDNVAEPLCWVPVHLAP